jgi:peptidase M23-like protein
VVRSSAEGQAMGKSRATIALVVCLLSFVAPALPCLAVALAPARSWLDLALVAGAALGWLALLVLTSWWEFTGLWLRWAWTAAFGASLLVRVAARPPPEAWAAPGAPGIAAAALIAPALWLLVGALRARRAPDDALRMEFPLRGGRFLVTDGGDGAASFLVNYHLGFGAHRGAGVSASMRYAMDVVEVGRMGVEAPGLLPARNDAYRIWERPLHAPCDGIVARVVDDVEDNTAFGQNRPYGVGNQVVIRVGADVYVVLGHMRRGSACVRPGDAVRAGDVLGRVGNSGWTERPHVHVQAMRSAGGDPWHGAPLAMRFDGRFLVKNQVIDVAA